MKGKIRRLVLMVLCVGLVTACQVDERGSSEEPRSDRGENFYATAVQYTGENESDQIYLEIAQRSDTLFKLLEEHEGAFVMDAYNYQTIDENGTMLYSQNTHDLPVEIDSSGYCINESVNYFRYNPIETATEEPVRELIVWDSHIQNILVPEEFAEYASEILEEYRQLFYFEKVEVANIYNQAVGAPLDQTSPEELSINLIYVKDNQEYFTYRSDLARSTGNIITNPVVRIYTGNTHISYAHSYMTQFISFHAEADTAEEAYQQIFPYIQQAGAQDSVQKVRPAMEL